MSAAGPSQLELVVLDWFKSWIGYPPQAAGILVSGGSAANITALACAREALVGAGSERAVAYVADQTHSSVARAARLIGFRPDQLRVLPTDESHRLRVDALAGAVQADMLAGLHPLILAANGGATNTGAVDPLHALADFCHEHGIWLHVDAAYGGFASLSERGRRLLAGIERADSVTLDPHKWLYQPIECGSLLVRNGQLLWEAFTINPVRSALISAIPWSPLHSFGRVACRRVVSRESARLVPQSGLRFQPWLNRPRFGTSVVAGGNLRIRWWAPGLPVLWCAWTSPHIWT